MDTVSLKTEADLLLLKGQHESARLEFKSSGIFEEGKNKIVDDLTEQVSAFANSEGGVIVIGIRDHKDGKTRVAYDLDNGVLITKVSPEWLQQTIEANVSPYLPGIRFQHIRLSGLGEGRYAYVITVPKGNTAYQAHDKLYYGRSEYENKALPDHEIRLRMMRGRIAHARMEIVNCGLVKSVEQKLKDWKTAQAAWKSTHPEFDSLPEPERIALLLSGSPCKPAPVAELELSLQIRNTGEVTLRDFLLSLSFECSRKAQFVDSVVIKEGVRVASPAFGSQNEQRYPSVHAVGDGEGPRKLFPGDTELFPSPIGIQITQGHSLSQYPFILRWTIYLDDAPSVSGSFNLSEEVNKALLPIE